MKRLGGKSWTDGGSDCWITTWSGTIMNLLDPSPDEVWIYDIAHALAHCCRFSGHVDTFYSVAQHSVLVSQIVPKEDALWALFHDAHEAYVGDTATPLKQRVPGIKDIEWLIQIAICDRFDLPHAAPASVHEADQRLLHTEKRDLLSNSCNQVWAGSDRFPPLRDQIQPWSAAVARAQFLDRYRVLTGLARRSAF